MAKKKTSMHISADKHEMLEKKAWMLSKKIDKPISWTELVNYTIDNYLDEAIKDIEHSTKDIIKKVQ